MFYYCRNCGHTREAHNPNLVNEPAKGDLIGIDTAAPGYPMSILACMEAPWPEDYAKNAEKLDFGFHCQRDGQGYVSPNIEEEAERADRELRIAGSQTTVVIIYSRRTGASVVLPP